MRSGGQDEPRRPRVSPRRGLLISLLSLLLFFGSLEGLLRGIGYFPERQRPGFVIFLVDPVYRYRIAPNLKRAVWATRTEEGRPDRTWVTSNSAGLREDHEIPLEKPVGERRIWSAGDSIAMGLGVDGWETYAERLEVLLARRLGLVSASADIRAGGRSRTDRLEVINAGVTGWCTLQERLLLEKEGLTYSPDLVLLQTCVNDPYEALEYRKAGWNWRSNEQIAAQIYEPPGWARDLRERLVENVSVAYLTHRSLIRLSARVKALRRGAASHGEFDAMFDLFAGDLLALRDLLGEREIPLLVAIFPHTRELREGASSEYAHRTRELCRREGIPHVELLPGLREFALEKRLPPESLIIEQDDETGSHLTVLGHGRAAVELVEPLAGLLASTELTPPS